MSISDNHHPGILQSAKHRAAKLRREIYGYALSVRYPYRSGAAQFILISGGRRGSHLLIDLLNSHPEIQCDGEILHRNRIRRKTQWPRMYLRGMRKRVRTPAYGFKASIRDLQRQQLEPVLFLTAFRTDGGRVITLRRENILRLAISSEVAQIRGRHHDSIANPLHKQSFRIDCRTLMHHLHKRKRQSRREQDLVAQLQPDLDLVYESDLLRPTQHQKTADRVFELLGRWSVPVQTNLFRTSPDELSAVISNYQEVVDLIKGTEFEEYLDDPNYNSADAA